MNTETGNVEIHHQRTSEGATRLDVLIDGQSVSHLVIIPITLRIGVASVPVAGISDVWTDEAHRNQGHARRLLEATLHHMRGSRAALSLLYGIKDFYPKFGYTTIGPMYHLRITNMAYQPILPVGWHVRPIRRSDLPAIKRLYELNTMDAVGAAIRPARSRVWFLLAEATAQNSTDECRVVTNESGQLVAYAWRGASLGYVHDFERYGPDTLVLAEVMAGSAKAADAILGVCCRWAAEEAARREKPLQWVYTGLPPWSMVATAAAYHENWLDAQSFHSGGFMARIVSIRRLMITLQPELERRLRIADSRFNGVLHIQTEEGEVTLLINRNTVSLSKSVIAAPQTELDIQLPQTALVRLALGAFPPTDVLARLTTSPSEQAVELLSILFPRRDIHLYLPDRP